MVPQVASPSFCVTAASSPPSCARSAGAGSVEDVVMAALEEAERHRLAVALREVDLRGPAAAAEADALQRLEDRARVRVDREVLEARAAGRGLLAGVLAERRDRACRVVARRDDEMVRAERDVGLDARHEVVRRRVCRGNGHLLAEEPFLARSEGDPALVERERRLLRRGPRPRVGSRARGFSLRARAGRRGAARGQGRHDESHGERARAAVRGDGAGHRNQYERPGRKDHAMLTGT